MLVVVASVLSVLVAVMHEVRVVAVADGFVATVSAVGVILDRVLRLGLVFVIVTLVESVVVRAMNVIGVIVVLDCLMPAVDTVLVLGQGVLSVDFDCRHDRLFLFSECVLEVLFEDVRDRVLNYVGDMTIHN
ncbi:hypothetical protein [Cryobacterium sp. SO1]|uniref:hypothetical protein n=1 Tax=Cryobacterium sp. SO1 TaxID=1897061 RepID=UPI0010D0A298|nr:hypothetical protein [Cryobacterium sp. SO1]RZI34263.1 hypothetical protein BJQ95_03404 [Cryobacterium sp. SO1]